MRLEDQEEPIIGATYRHYKGKLYYVTGIAKHSETLEDLVVYVCLYENAGAQLWVRPKRIFMDEAESDGKLVKRFVRT